MGYRENRQDESGSSLVGTAIGCLAAFAFLMTGGLIVLFGVTWGCVPAHRIAGQPCSVWVTPAALAAIGAATLLIFWLVKRGVQWLAALFRRRQVDESVE